MLMSYRFFLAALGGLLLTVGVAGAQEQPQNRSPNADNTRTNKRDRAQSGSTSDQAKNNLSDRELMQKIRRALIEDKSLSTYAHNIKIIAQNGKVTLKGPVRSEGEKKAVEQKAEEAAGRDNVSNEITVKAARIKKTS